MAYPVYAISAGFYGPQSSLSSVILYDAKPAAALRRAKFCLGRRYGTALPAPRLYRYDYDARAGDMPDDMMPLLRQRFDFASRTIPIFPRHDSSAAAVATMTPIRPAAHHNADAMADVIQHASA